MTNFSQVHLRRWTISSTTPHKGRERTSSPSRPLTTKKMGFSTFITLTSFSFYAAFLVVASSPSPTEPKNVVDLGYASYRGHLSFPNTMAYLGIPYAEPPVEERRFRSPIALNTTRVEQEANGKIVDATAYPEFCIQGSTGREYYVRITHFMVLYTDTSVCG